MSRLIKSYRTEVTGEHLLRITPVAEISLNQIASPQEDPNQVLDNARREALEIIRQAEETAAGKLNDAAVTLAQQKAEIKQAAQELNERSRQEGYDAGYQEGLRAAEDQVSHLQQSAASIVNEAIKHRKEFLSNSEPVLVELAVAIAEKIIRKNLEVDSDVISQIVRTCLYDVLEKGIVEVRVHPDDYENLVSSRSELYSHLSVQAELVFVPDVTISPGGCLIITQQGSIDARLETGLEEIRKALKEVCGEIQL